jgi:hypothetical protein
MNYRRRKRQRPIKSTIRKVADLDVVGDEKKAVVVNPGDTGFASAYPNLCSLLANKWKIEHSDDDLIGIRVREM